MIIIIDRPLKIRLLKAIQAGKYDPDLFPELNIVERPRPLTVKEAADLYRELDKGNFDIPKNQ